MMTAPPVAHCASRSPAWALRLFEAARGEEALSLVRVTWFDAVLLDVDMPGMGGVEACRSIRHAIARLPILMLTVMDSEDDKVLALDAGADDYITKPFQLRELNRPPAFRCSQKEHTGR